MSALMIFRRNIRIESKTIVKLLLNENKFDFNCDNNIDIKYNNIF
jgi:hypothetical protein